MPEAKRSCARLLLAGGGDVAFLPRYSAAATEAQHNRPERAPKLHKANAIRALDAHKIAYSTFLYTEIDSARNGLVLGVPASGVYKPLVAQADADDGCW